MEMSTGSDRDIGVLVAGHACLDIIPSFPTQEPMQPEKVFRPGGLIIVGGASICLGGPVSNTGIGISKLGGNVHFVTRLGDDTFGQSTLKLMQETASTDGVHVVRGEDSSYTVAIAPPGIDRLFFHDPGTNSTFSSEDVDFQLCQRAKIFHLGYPPLMRRLFENDGAELIKIFQMVREAGALTSLDMALPDPNSESGKVDWVEVLKNLLPYVDFFLPSIEESLFMLDREKYNRLNATPGDIIDKLDGEDYSVLSDQLIEWGAAVVALKSGHRGFYCRTADDSRIESLAVKPEGFSQWVDREVWCPAFTVNNIASATGSGDSAVAGFLTAFLEREPFERCTRYAVAMGYQNLHGLDGTSGIRDWEYTTDLVEKLDQPQIRFELKTSGWQFLETGRMWRGPNDHLGP